MSQYGDSSLLIDDQTVVARKAVSEHVAGRFARAYAITPLAYTETGAVGELAAVYTRGEVDLSKPEDVARVQQVFAAANRLALPLVVHLATGDPASGRVGAETFLAQLLSRAPDVVVQIAHLAGTGPGWNDEALAVLAEAVERGDPRAGKLYFDVATVADLQKHDQLELLAKRIRQIGPQRILYGSDAAFGGRSTPDREWALSAGWCR